MNKVEIIKLCKEWNKDPKSIWNTNPNLFAKNLYTKLKNKKITLEDYSSFFDEFQRLRADWMKSVRGLNYRLDRRTLAEFAIQIYENEYIENLIAEEWVPNYAHKHFECLTTIEAVPNGIENDGLLILENVKSAAETKEPDYLLTPIDIPLEVKVCPCGWKGTYKVGQLKTYIERNAWMLTVYFDGDKLWDNKLFYTIISTNEMKKMLKVHTQSAVEMGDKTSIQFYTAPPHPEGLSPHSRAYHVTRGKLQKTAPPIQDFTTIWEF